MPKVGVYLPDELYAKARELGVSLSAVTQEALERRIAEASVSQWLTGQLTRPPRRTAVSVTTEELMDAVDEELGA